MKYYIIRNVCKRLLIVVIHHCMQSVLFVRACACCTQALEPQKRRLDPLCVQPGWQPHGHGHTARSGPSACAIFVVPLFCVWIS